MLRYGDAQETARLLGDAMNTWQRRAERATDPAQRRLCELAIDDLWNLCRTAGVRRRFTLAGARVTYYVEAVA